MPTQSGVPCPRSVVTGWPEGAPAEPEITRTTGQFGGGLLRSLPLAWGVVRELSRLAQSDIILPREVSD